MPYATTQQMVSRFTLREVIALTDRNNTGAVDEVELGRALTDASGEIDAHLGRRYALPLTAGGQPMSAPPQILIGLCCDIARYRLTGTEVQETEAIRARYKDAINVLKLLAAGDMVFAESPDLVGAGNPNAAGSAVATTTSAAASSAATPSGRTDMQMVSRIENAMVDALRAAAGLASFRVPTIESYGGQLDDDLLEWVRVLPAMWVVFAGTDKPKAESVSKSRWRYSGTFTVFHAQRNLAGNRAVRQGDATNPGVYALMQLAAGTLLGRDLGLDIKELQPGSVSTVFSGIVNRDAVMVYATNWHAEWIETVPPPAAEPEGYLETLNLKYFLEPGDDQADAEDAITTQGTTP